MMLNAAAIMAEAEASVGIKDSEARYYQPNLERLVASINAEASLSPQGEARVGAGLLKRATFRLEGLKWLRGYPEIGEEAIAAPVFLTGLQRSGTTFIQYLFDHDPRFRLIRTWEANQPFPPPGHDPQSVSRREAEEEERRQRLLPLLEGFEAMHLSDPKGPEECHAFMEQGFAAAGFYNLLSVPGYFDYLMEGLDLTAAYRLHKRQLQLLQWRMPQPRWALKYPNHLIAMDAILEVYPDARFVMTHRDPVQVLASTSKLTLKLRRASSIGSLDPHAVGRQMLDFVQRHIDRLMAFTGTDANARVCHVDYYRLVDNPAKVMKEVHAALGIDTPEPVRTAVADWHRRNPKGARGSNLYAPEDFGLNADAVAERFADYMRRFDIPREQAGLARTAG